MPWTNYSFPESSRYTGVVIIYSHPFQSKNLFLKASSNSDPSNYAFEYGALLSILDSPFYANNPQILSNNTLGYPEPEPPELPPTPSILPEWRKISKEIG